MLVRGTDGKNRCFGGGPHSWFYGKYHDEEWGIPIKCDQKLFEYLSLETQQAGLSFKLILKKRDDYRKAFFDFDPQKIAAMSDTDLILLLSKSSKLVRNKLKIFAIRKNAQVFCKIQKEHGSFANYIWEFVDHKPIINRWHSLAEAPCFSPLSEQVAKELKNYGMSFVGKKIIYSFMQATGMINDHVLGCHLAR